MNKVLLYLFKKNEFVSGEDISREFSISRTAVWKHINSAKNNGIEIEAVSGKGYRVIKIPEDKIIPELVLSKLDNPAFDIIYLPELNSTNTYAKENITSLNDKDYLVITDNQTKGRGRHERKWESEKGKDLTFSLIIHPDTEVKFFYNFTIISSLSIYKTLINFIENKEKLLIKWPNDLYYENKKICGILSEMVTEEALLKSLIIGIGININSTPSLDCAISLKQIRKINTDRHEILTLFLENFYSYYNTWKDRFDYLFDEWKKKLKNLGEIINFKHGDREFKGKFAYVEKDGSIKIETDGEIITFYSGEFL